MQNRHHRHLRPGSLDHHPLIPHYNSAHASRDFFRPAGLRHMCWLIRNGSRLHRRNSGDASVRASAQQPRMFVAMMPMPIFAEDLGLYGLIVALLMMAKASDLLEQAVC